MRVLFTCDYFPPFIKGGGEISAYWQAKKLLKNGIDIVVLAPKYKDKLKIENEKFKTYFFKLPFKVSKITPLIFLNPLYVFYQLIQIIKVIKKEKIDIIHCQGKYSVPAAILTKLFLKIPVVLTLRDYKGICNHGFCLYKGKKGCNLLSFFKKDFLFYFKNYVKNKNLFSFLFQFIASYIGRINTLILSFFMKRADWFICVSNYIADVYSLNGYDKRKMTVVYNPAPIVKVSGIKLPQNLKNKINQYKFKILYAGKLSLGKGTDILIKSAQQIVLKRKDVLFIFCGRISYPIKIVKNNQLLFLGKIDNQLLLKIMGLSDIICIPSVWQEPLSRVVFEAFSLKKPVLSSLVGGQKELVNNKTGWTVKPGKKDFMVKLEQVLQNKDEMVRRGEEGFNLINQIKEKQINKLIFLYQSLKRNK